MADPAPALAFSHIEKRYGRITALDGVSFSVGAGEFVGLLGPNGSGKSTLFQIASGLFVPDGGDVEVFGRSYGDAPSAILSRIGVVFQTRSVDLDMSVLANLKFHGALFGLSGRELKQRVDEVVQLLGIEPARRRLVRELSGGNQRRVEIARALLNRPELLLMDEPSMIISSGCSVRGRWRCCGRPIWWMRSRPPTASCCWWGEKWRPAARPKPSAPRPAPARWKKPIWFWPAIRPRRPEITCASCGSRPSTIHGRAAPDARLRRPA
jgi:ABC-type lipoprotein export system ATPase subunit